MNRFGWKGRTPFPDPRDKAHAYRRMFAPVPLPKVKDLICAPVVDQDNLGACVWFAIIAHLAATAVENDLEPVDLSQLYGYYRYRELHGDINSDDGCYIRDAVKLANKEGICHGESWKYIISNWNKKPPKECYYEAPEHRVLSYHTLESLEDMLQSIAMGYGFVGGISCYESLDDPVTQQTGIVRMPGAEEKLQGGHAIFFCGYDIHKQMFKFQNSWGKGWGDKGFGYIPFRYVNNPYLAADFWTVRS